MQFVTKYVPDRDKAQKMCDKVILQICGMLIFTPGLCKDQKMCDDVDENYVQASGFVLDCC